jgi:nitroreductase
MATQKTTDKAFLPYRPPHYPPQSMLERAREFRSAMEHRRSCRYFSSVPVNRLVIEEVLATASRAPSGANKQPWTFVAVSNPLIKKEIRHAAEQEEYQFYHQRATEEWLEDLRPLGTTWEKPYLEEAPWLIVVFKHTYEATPAGKRKNYYVNESVGLAAGVLLSALQYAGLATLTHTPSPMDFLARELNRPANEKPFLLIPTGYPREDALVPNIERKPLEEMRKIIE